MISASSARSSKRSSSSRRRAVSQPLLGEVPAMPLVVLRRPYRCPGADHIFSYLNYFSISWVYIHLVPVLSVCYVMIALPPSPRRPSRPVINIYHACYVSAALQVHTFISDHHRSFYSRRFFSRWKRHASSVTSRY
jgi:hypothetical protein